MITETLNSAVSELVADMNSGEEDWFGCLRASGLFTPRAEKLTDVLCCSDTADAIVEDAGIAYLLVANEVLGNWDIEEIAPIDDFKIEFTTDHVGNDDVEFLEEFTKELAYQCSGFEVYNRQSKKRLHNR